MKKAPHLNCGLLKLDALEKALTTLVKGKSDVVLYGNKSSGKTRLATKILSSVVGQDYFINIKSIFATDRDSLLYLIGDEFVKLIANLDSYFIPKN